VAGIDPTRAPVLPDLYFGSHGDNDAGSEGLVGTLMLIEHDPGLHPFTLALASAGDDLERLEATVPTAALATLSLPVQWGRLGRGPRRSPPTSFQDNSVHPLPPLTAQRDPRE
jgi:hypothetical protein